MSTGFHSRNFVTGPCYFMTTNFNECWWLWLALENLVSVDGDCFSGGHEVYLLFNFDSVNYLLKTTGGETEALILLFR